MGIQRLVLASASPRRRLLLELLGFPFTVRPVDLDERPLRDEPPAATALRLATEKAATAPADDDQVVLAADTVVILDGSAMGKPADNAHAMKMLTELRGRWHRVITSLVLRVPIRQCVSSGSVQSLVHMRAYEDWEIAASIQRGTLLDKAGSYGIQDEHFRPVDALDGCYLNVVGLPLCQLSRQLHDLGMQPVAPAAGESASACSLCRAGAALPGIGGGWLLAETTMPSEPTPDS